MTTTPVAKTKRAAAKRSAVPSTLSAMARRSIRQSPPPGPSVEGIVSETPYHAAFVKLPLAERKRRIQAFIDALAPAFADYSSEDFRAEQRREAERDNH